MISAVQWKSSVAGRNAKCTPGVLQKQKIPVFFVQVMFSAPQGSLKGKTNQRDGHL